MLVSSSQSIAVQGDTAGASASSTRTENSRRSFRTSTDTGPIGLPSFNAPTSGCYFANGRRIFWWIEHEDIGRLSVGRTDLPGLFATIDMTGGQLYLVAGDPSFINGSFFIRGPAGQYYAMVWGFIIDAAQGYNR